MVEVAALVQMGLLGEALERGPVAVFVFDDEARYVAVNAYACDLLGYEREELLALRAGALSIADDPLGDYAAVVRGDVPEGPSSSGARTEASWPCASAPARRRWPR